MNCQDFERIWDKLLDAGQAVSGHRGPGMESSEPQSPSSTEMEAEWLDALREHARTCHACQPRMRPLETLRLALERWDRAPKPIPSADLTDRILAAVRDENARILPMRPRTFKKTGWVAAIASSAAAVLAISFLSRNPPRPGAAPRPNPGLALAKPESARLDVRALNQAIADASDATWDLAYVASAPAVRIGHHVFDSSEGSGSNGSQSTPRPGRPGPSADLRPGLFPADAAGEVVSRAISLFGEEISAGVRPFSDSARRAIDFLRESVPPADGGAELPPTPPDSKGA